MHDKIVFKNIANGAVTHETDGIDAFRVQAEQAAATFAEREQKIENIAFSGDDECEVDIDYLAKLAVDLPR